MEDVRNLIRICPICGKTINYKEIYDDGRDWEGHQRGTPGYRKEGYHCTCDSTPFKRMCINCKYYENYTLYNMKNYQYFLNLLIYPFYFF